jgi:hypothetical protein
MAHKSASNGMTENADRDPVLIINHQCRRTGSYANPVGQIVTTVSEQLWAEMLFSDLDQMTPTPWGRRNHPVLNRRARPIAQHTECEQQLRRLVQIRSWSLVFAESEVAR